MITITRHHQQPDPEVQYCEFYYEISGGTDSERQLWHKHGLTFQQHMDFMGLIIWEADEAEMKDVLEDYDVEDDLNMGDLSTIGACAACVFLTHLMLWVV
jgi:hypothetical protein